jgi:hypothetical protein
VSDQAFNIGHPARGLSSRPLGISILWNDPTKIPPVEYRVKAID